MLGRIMGHLRAKGHAGKGRPGCRCQGKLCCLLGCKCHCDRHLNLLNLLDLGRRSPHSEDHFRGHWQEIVLLEPRIRCQGLLRLLLLLLAPVARG